MARFRLLSKDELEEFRKEFIDFLTVNGIDAIEWKRIKKEESNKAEKTIELFSDFIFESIFRKTDYLDFISKNKMIAFRCMPNKMMSVIYESFDENVNFADDNFLHLAKKNPPKNISVTTSEKLYSKSREEEMFDLIEKGCIPSEGKLFQSLILAL